MGKMVEQYIFNNNRFETMEESNKCNSGLYYYKIEIIENYWGYNSIE